MTSYVKKNTEQPMRYFALRLCVNQIEDLLDSHTEIASS